MVLERRKDSFRAVKGFNNDDNEEMHAFPVSGWKLRLNGGFTFVAMHTSLYSKKVLFYGFTEDLCIFC